MSTEDRRRGFRKRSGEISMGNCAIYELKLVKICKDDVREGKMRPGLRGARRQTSADFLIVLTFGPALALDQALLVSQ